MIKQLMVDNKADEKSTKFPNLSHRTISPRTIRGENEDKIIKRLNRAETVLLSFPYTIQDKNDKRFNIVLKSFIKVVILLNTLVLNITARKETINIFCFFSIYDFTLFLSDTL